MCIENTHFKCLKSYYRDSRVEVTHLLLECLVTQNVELFLLQVSEFPDTNITEN